MVGFHSLIIWDGEDRCGLGDNVYTVRYSEVVSEGCYHVAVVSDSADWAMGIITGVAPGLSLRNHVSQAGLCPCTLGHAFLV